MSHKNLDVEGSAARLGLEFEELDHARDEMRFESLGEDDRKGGNQRRIIESLEQERKRVGQMEAELLRIKRGKSSSKDFSILKKNSKALSIAADKMSQANEKESLAVIEWDQEWQQKLSSFRKQHREMEDALKSRHLAELKSLEGDLQRNIRHLAVDAPRAKNATIPSPRSLSLLQEENTRRVVALFQKQAQERLVLASKISKQEELLIKSKNQSLHKISNEAQAIAAKYYRQFNLPQPQISYQPTQASSKRIRVPYLGLSRESSTSPSETTMDGAASALDTQSTKQPSHDLSSTGWEDANPDFAEHGNERFKISLSTPRLDEENCTFLTEIECYDSRADFRSVGKGSTEEEVPRRATKGQTTIEDGQEFSEKSYGTVGTGPAGFRQSLSTRSLGGAVSHTGPGVSKTGPELSAPNDTSAPVSTFPVGKNHSSESAVGDDPKSAPSRNSRGTFLSQVIAPTYPAPMSKAMRINAGTKKPTISPYLLPQTADYGKGNSKKNSKSIRGSAQYDAGRNEHYTAARAATTLPLMNSFQSQRSTGTLSRAGSDDSRTVFPHLTDANSMNPHKDLEALTSPPSSEKSESFLKLESWIEAKIKSILAGQGEYTHHNGGPNQSNLSDGSEQPLRNNSTNNIDSADSGTRPLTNDGGYNGQTRGADATQGADDSSNGDISNLLLRLRTTIAAEQANREPHDQSQKKSYFRNGMEKNPSAPANGGLGFFNPKERRSELSNRNDFFKGQDVKQEEADPPPSAFALTEDEEDYEAKKEAERSRKEADRRNRLDELPVDQMQTSQTKMPKKVGWRLGDDPNSDPAQTLLVDSDSEVLPEFRPETGQTTSTLPSRPDTSTSSLQDIDSRPETSAAADQGDFDLERDFFSLVRHNKVREFEDILATSKLPIDVRDRYGNTSLMIAAQNGHKRLVKLCLQNNAEINASNHQGNTALHYAYSYGYTTVANYLIAKGADDTMINHQGKTCYER